MPRLVGTMVLLADQSVNAYPTKSLLFVPEPVRFRERSRPPKSWSSVSRTINGP
jgi:hypothetical protein